MKKIILTIFILISFIEINAQNFGIQILAGSDIYKINSMEKGFNLFDLTKANIKREEFSNPISAELNLVYDKINWNLTLSLDAAYTNYNVVYTRNVPQLFDPFYIKTSKYKIDFARAAASLNYIKNISLTSRLMLFVGGGPTFFITAPVVSDKFIINTLKDKFSELDLSDDIKLRYSFGAIVQSGIKFKVFNPIDLLVTAKYFVTSKGEYEEPYSFAAIHAGFGITF
jgi:hypothetical protein